jgi:hypothetical protein
MRECKSSTRVSAQEPDSRSETESESEEMNQWTGVPHTVLKTTVLPLGLVDISRSNIPRQVRTFEERWNRMA